MGEKIVSSIKGVWETGELCKRIKSDPSITSYIQINSKWIKDFNIKAEVIKLLEENTGLNSMT